MWTSKAEHILEEYIQFLENYLNLDAILHFLPEEKRKQTKQELRDKKIELKRLKGGE
jgi:hypothetical protein